MAQRRKVLLLNWKLITTFTGKPPPLFSGEAINLVLTKGDSIYGKSKKFGSNKGHDVCAAIR